MKKYDSGIVYIHQESLRDLTRVVNEYAAHGWRISGPLVPHEHCHLRLYIQRMKKMEDSGEELPEKISEEGALLQKYMYWMHESEVEMAELRERLAEAGKEIDRLKKRVW